MDILIETTFGYICPSGKTLFRVMNYPDIQNKISVSRRDALSNYILIYNLAMSGF